MNCFRRFRRSEAGNSIVELALTAPFLMAFLVSIVDIGRMEHYNTIVANSARAGVQYGAQNTTTALDNTGMTAAANADAQNLSGLTVTPSTYCKCSDGSAATCSPPTTCPASGHILTYVSVYVTYTFHTLFNYKIIPATMTLTRTIVQQVAQ
jgi:Flp pilus assembly protein TadG